MTPQADRAVKMIIGSGGSLSAIIGAAIERILAPKLQNPKAVEQNKVGNMSTVEQYTITNPPVMPNLHITTKRGISKVAESPRKMIMKPPIVDMVNSKENDFLIPIRL
jgi:hypothetical protein